MVSRSSWILAVTVVFVLAGGARADNMTFTSGGSNIWYNSYESVYVSPYTARDNSQGNISLSIYCLDWNHNISVGTNWTADVVPLVAADASYLYYNSNTISTAYNVSLSGSTLSLVASAGPVPSAFTRYLEAAWLFSQAMATSDLILQQEINIAAWTLFISSPPANIPAFANAINNSGYGTAVYNYVQAAQTAVANGFTAANWYAITPDPKSGSNLTQEFLTYVPPTTGNLVPTVVPEPAALILLATVVGILSLRASRRQQRRV